MKNSLSLRNIVVILWTFFKLKKKEVLKLLFFFNFIFVNIAFTNPFLIDLNNKEHFVVDDYMTVQLQLKQIEISQLISEYYQKFIDSGKADPRRFPYSAFYHRCSVGINWAFSDPKKGNPPIKNLCKINNGGDCCIVCVSSYNKIYPELMLSNITWLEKSGFNGYYLYFLGEYPNPTGEEIQYVGVPYAFKIFAMLEAQKLGFDKVLWLDASAKVLKDPTPLFEILDKTGCLFTTPTTIFPWWQTEDQQKKIFPQTRNRLYELTGIDVAHSKRYVPATIIGFKMNDPLTKKFINKYYELVKDGYGFISEAPEEYIFSSILAQDDFMEWEPVVNLKLMSHQKSKILMEKKSSKKKKRKKKRKNYLEIEDHEGAQKDGYFFYYRKH